jgi:hypothetical protein
MNKQKRVFLAGLSSVAVCGIIESIATRVWAGSPLAQNKLPQIPSAADPGNTAAQNAPPAPFPGPNLDPRVDPKQVLQHNNSQIHDDVEKLYYLAKELKAEVDKNVTENVLSLAMVQKCEQIEKYAKQIKNLAKG